MQDTSVKSQVEGWVQPSLSDLIFSQLAVDTVKVQARGEREITMDDFNGTDWNLGEGDKLLVTGVPGGKVKVKMTVAWEVRDES